MGLFHRPRTCNINIKTTEERGGRFDAAAEETRYTKTTVLESLIDLFCSLSREQRVALVLDPQIMAERLAGQPSESSASQNQ